MRSHRLFGLLPLLGALAACGGDPAAKDPTGGEDSGGADGGGADGGGDGGAPWAPDTACPGGAGCADNAGALRAGAASRVITPQCFEGFDDLDADAEWDSSDEAFLDCGCDRLCPADAGYPGADAGEGDGDFQAVWMAGFQNARAAQGVHDDLYARAVVFDQGQTRVAFVVVDLIGWFHADVELSRAALQAAGADVDLLVVSATHTHEGPDTMGLWGKTPAASGVDPADVAEVRAQIEGAVLDAVADLREVGEMKVGHVNLGDRPEGVPNYVRDARDPKVIDQQVSAAWFADTEGRTITTLAHLANHPEAMADENSLLSSDFPHRLREGVEEGVDWGAGLRPGLGGTAIFVNGAVGGMMTPLGITVNTPDGRALRDYTFEKNSALGEMMAERVLDAVEAGSPASAPSLYAASHRFRLPVDNWGFQAMFISGIIARETVGWDPAQSISETNVPQIITEMSYIRVGPLELYTMPGEVLPELMRGCYDGACTGGPDIPLIDADNPNPPDMAAAPAGPYYEDRLQGALRLLVGLGNDELGYIIPPFQFELHDTVPWFDEAEGDHYEETNALSPTMGPRLDEELVRLTTWAYAAWPTAR
jgi:hypothetical protein